MMSGVMSDQAKHTEVQLGLQGRLVIPAPLRRALGFEPGETLLVRVEDDRLVLEKQESVKRRLKARFAAIPSGRSLARELLADRREEAKREEPR